jgi:ATP synthase protein I
MAQDKGPQKPKDRVREASILATASSMGLSLVIAMFLGVAGGLYLDRLLGTKPWFFLIGLILGIVAGYRNLFILAARLDKKQGKNDD